MKILPVALLTFLTINCVAQSLVSTRISAGVDVGAGFKGGQLAPSIAYYQLLNVGEKKLISFGYSLKFGTFYGNNLDYITAPARLTRGKDGFSALGASLIPANIDTVSFTRVSMTNLNLGFKVQIQLGPVQVGATADILGLGFGKSRTGQYKSSTGAFTAPSSGTTATTDTLSFQGTNGSQSAFPSNFNVRLLGDNNLGTLSSEVYARFLFTKRIGVKVGYQWLTTEISVRNRDVKADNDRFRNRQSFPYVAITFPLFQ